MRSLDTLKLTPVWVNPGHQVASARILLQGHNLRALTVIEGDEIVGLVTLGGLASALDHMPVREVMEEPEVVLDASTSVRRAAQLFVEADIEYAPVVREGQFLGLVSSTMLLRELGRSWDPLTGLRYSDYLREWGVENLEAGVEITILFIDLDDFGHFNKRYGHIVGDKVLRCVAHALNDAVDPEREIVVRYGGDEFAVGTIRPRPEAEALAESIRDAIGKVRLPDINEPIGFCLGLHGGKRTHERDSVHYSATLDDLINLASKDCMRQKRGVMRLAAVEVRQTGPPPPKRRQG